MLEKLYAELERKQADDLQALQEPERGLSVLEGVGKALEFSLGVEDIDLSQPYSFADLGGDSLGAAGFSSLLSDIFDVSLPVNAILSPAGDARQWAQSIEALQTHEISTRPTFTTIHETGARELKAKDVDITRFLDAATLDNAATEQPPADSNGVLLTGATGFLGRFLCQEWLQRLATTGGTLFCLVRASDSDTARRGLTNAFAFDARLLDRFRELATDHLEIVVGDIGEQGLGIDAQQTYDRVATEVDRIVHPAALVNHLLDYEFLFDANVAGTAALAGLAITRRQKRIDFVSSIAAARFVDHALGHDEDSPLRQRITLSDGYGSSYGASKWAGEELLHSVHRRFGVPVNVYRGDMMLAHSRFIGQINVPDVFTRLVLSLVMTGLAPESFYELDRAGRRQRGHYDGLPVDFIASAIVGSSLEPHRDVRTFHVVNHHAEDGISLDTIVDWIAASGYPIERVGGFHEWLTSFEQRMNALTKEQRQHSSLGVLDMFRGPQDPTRPMIGCTRFQHAVAGLPGGVHVPHLSREFIDKCLADLRALGLPPEPTRSAG